MVDRGSQGTSSSDTNLHGMVGDKQTVSDARAAIDYIIGNAFGSSRTDPRYENLPAAIHTTQDVATPLHYLQKWDGGELDWHTVEHLFADTFPSISTISDAYQRTLDVFKSRDAQSTPLSGGDLMEKPGK